MPDLEEWKEQIARWFPMLRWRCSSTTCFGSPEKTSAIGALQSAATRTGPSDYHVPSDLGRFRIEDRWAPKFDHWWAFPVCAYDHTLGGNERAVFEHVRDDPSIKKIVLTRSRPVDLGGENVVVVPLISPEGQHYLARARQIFVKHGPHVNAHWPISRSRTTSSTCGMGSR